MEGGEATSGAHSNTVRHLVPGPRVIPFLRNTRRSFLSAAIFCLISFIHSFVSIRPIVFRLNFVPILIETLNISACINNVFKIRISVCERKQSLKAKRTLFVKYKLAPFLVIKLSFRPTINCILYNAHIKVNKKMRSL